jgi:hypothetical protein
LTGWWKVQGDPPNQPVPPFQAFELQFKDGVQEKVEPFPAAGNGFLFTNWNKVPQDPSDEHAGELPPGTYRLHLLAPTSDKFARLVVVMSMLTCDSYAAGYSGIVSDLADPQAINIRGSYYDLSGNTGIFTMKRTQPPA